LINLIAYSILCELINIGTLILENVFITPSDSGGNLSFISGFKLIPSLQIGYSVTSQIGNWTRSANSRSHEIYIKFSTSKSLSKSSDETSIGMEVETPQQKKSYN
jgi:hypothetical protein